MSPPRAGPGGWPSIDTRNRTDASVVTVPSRDGGHGRESDTQFGRRGCSGWLPAVPSSSRQPAPLIQSQTGRGGIKVMSVALNPPRRCEVFRSLVPEVIFRRPKSAQSAGASTPPASTDDVTIAEAGAGRFGEQALNDLLGLFVLALAKVMLPNPSARVEEVQRRSVGSTPATRPPTSQRRTFPRAQLQSPWPSSRQNVPDLIDSFSHVLHLRSVLRGVPRRKPATFRVPTVKRSISPPVTCEAI